MVGGGGGGGEGEGGEKKEKELYLSVGSARHYYRRGPTARWASAISFQSVV